MALIYVPTFNPVTANYVGKVSGSTVENPHVFKWANGSALINPSTGTESIQADYDRIKILDGVTQPRSIITSGNIAQHLFSFDLIQLAIRERGVPLNAMTTADAVTWLKANIRQLTCNWWGYGSGPSGNKAYGRMWNAATNVWEVTSEHSNAAVTKMVVTSANASVRVDANGFMHFLAYADASNGTTASVINTDYVDLYVEFRGIEVKTDWKADESINAADWNRIEGNTKTLREYLAAIQYAMPAITSVLNRDQTYIDFLSSINRIEQNIDQIRAAFVTPPGYPGAESWVRGKLFDFEDANRLETDILLLMEYAQRAFDSFRYCGTFYSGEEYGP